MHHDKIGRASADWIQDLDTERRGKKITVKVAAEEEEEVWPGMGRY